MAVAAKFNAINDLPVPVFAPMTIFHPRANPIPPPPPPQQRFHNGKGVGTASIGACFCSKMRSSVMPVMLSNATTGGSAPMGVAVRIQAVQMAVQSSASSVTAMCRSQMSFTPAPPTVTSRMTLAFGSDLATDATSVAPP